MIRPPAQDEKFANWETSAAGFKEEDEGWVFVPPADNVFTVFPGKSSKTCSLVDTIR